ncbi:TPA: MFS transporter, partial [Enterococcus faecium]
NSITQIGTVTFSGLGVPFLIATWFDEKSKASALGIAFAGGSIGNFFLQPIVTNLLNHYELHRVYFMCALASLVVGVLVGVFLIHPNKQPIESSAAKQSTDSSKDSKISTNQSVPQGTHPANTQTGIGYKKTTQQKSFWALSCFYLIIGLAISALSSQYANFFASIHINTTLIGTIGSTFAIACLVGNVGGGFLFSKIGVRNAMFLAFILQLVTVILLIASIFIPSIKVISAFAWAVLYGFNVYSYMSAPAVMMQTLFGMKDTSQILGVFSIFFAVGFALGNIVFGFFVDTFGFTAAWISILCYVLIGFSGLLFFITDIQKHKFADQTA